MSRKIVGKLEGDLRMKFEESIGVCIGRRRLLDDLCRLAREQDVLAARAWEDVIKLLDLSLSRQLFYDWITGEFFLEELSPARQSPAESLTMQCPKEDT